MNERIIKIREDNSKSVDFSKLKIGNKSLKDPTLDLDTIAKIYNTLEKKENILKVIKNCDKNKMREISNLFFKTSGIYSRLCKYMAYLYKYDWFIIPYIDQFNKNELSEEAKKKLTKNFYERLSFLDEFNPKKFFGEVALQVFINGCYYGYKIERGGRLEVQELPPNYCRSRFRVGGRPAVEFNMQFFDVEFKTTEDRLAILDIFPKEFSKGYLAYKSGKLAGEGFGNKEGWYLLSPENTIKFSINNEDYPPFISVIPALVDLDIGQALDKKKMEQKLFKLLIQKMPLDKNNELVFDLEEMSELHRNAVQMLGGAIGLKVLTTPADIAVADTSDRNTVTSIDDLSKLERAVFNESGTAQNLFNTEGNLALEKSILNDEASILNLITQFEEFLNDIIKVSNKKNKYKVQILNTTIYNYKDLAKSFKELTQLGSCSKILPMLALGQSQSSILAAAYFEKDVLDLVNVFVPPLSSSTMNADTLDRLDKKEGGREEKPDDQKSEKTIANRESMT